jgi:hypothetical protein
LELNEILFLQLPKTDSSYPAAKDKDLMTRMSTNKTRHGRVWSGFDYDLQVWVVGGIVQHCGHPQTMRLGGKPCCNAFRLAGQRIVDFSRDPDNKQTENLRLVKK